MSRINTRTGRVPSLTNILPLLSKINKVAAGLFPGVSKALLYLMGLLVLTNIHSFPLVWHCEPPYARLIHFGR